MDNISRRKFMQMIPGAVMGAAAQLHTAPKGFVYLYVKNDKSMNPAFLGMDKNKMVELGDYTTGPDRVPILIMSDGNWHGKSKDLTEKLLTPNKHPRAVKIIFDAHPDFQYDPMGDPCAMHVFFTCRQDTALDHRVFGISELGSYGYFFKEQRDRHFPNYNLFIDGGEAKDFYSPDAREFEFQSRSGSQAMLFSSRMNQAKKIFGKTIYISIDTDVLSEGQVKRMYKRSTPGPSLKELLEILEYLTENNTLIGADICGFTFSDEYNAYVYKKILNSLKIRH